MTGGKCELAQTLDLVKRSNTSASLTVWPVRSAHDSDQRSVILPEDQLSKITGRRVYDTESTVSLLFR